MTGEECFAAFGTKPRNVQWSWSARSEDGSVVVVRLWDDRLFDKARRYRVENYEGSDDRLRLGQRELMENLQHAVDRCGGIVRVILIRARDKTAIPRSIKEGWPSDLVMRVTNLDAANASADLIRVDAH